MYCTSLSNKERTSISVVCISIISSTVIFFQSGRIHGFLKITSISTSVMKGGTKQFVKSSALIRDIYLITSFLRQSIGGSNSAKVGIGGTCLSVWATHLSAYFSTLQVCASNSSKVLLNNSGINMIWATSRKSFIKNRTRAPIAYLRNIIPQTCYGAAQKDSPVYPPTTQQVNHPFGA